MKVKSQILGKTRVRSLLKQGCNSEDEDENAIAVQAEIHHESEVADAEIDERPIVVEAGLQQ